MGRSGAISVMANCLLYTRAARQLLEKLRVLRPSTPFKAKRPFHPDENQITLVCFFHGIPVVISYDYLSLGGMRYTLWLA
jgi:hypothetical protein